MAITVSGMPPVLVIVTDCAAESWPSGVAEMRAKRARGLRMSVGGAPGSGELHGLRSRTVGEVSRPVEDAGVVGANSTCSWQSEFAARLVVPQALLARINGGVTEMLLMGTAAALLLATVTVSGARRVPFLDWPKLTVAGRESDRAGDGPVPVRSTRELAAVDVGVDGHLARQRAGGLRRKRDLNGAARHRGRWTIHAVVGLAEVAARWKWRWAAERGCRC